MTGRDIVDMSLPLRDGMQLFPEIPSFESESSLSEETGALTRRFTTSTHQGTHVDAPSHFVDGPTMDELPLDLWMGSARVVDLRSFRTEPITAKTLEEHTDDVDKDDRILLLTGDVDKHFGDEEFFEEAAVLTPDAAAWLVDQGVSLIANDFLTESLDNPERPVHQTLLNAGIPIVEYLCNADEIADMDTVEFSCFPLRLPGFEASPVRAMATR